MNRNRPILTFIGAVLVLLFTAGPVALAFIGSIVPDRVMFSSDRHLSATGISCAPLPKTVLEAGRQIVARILAADPETVDRGDPKGRFLTDRFRIGPWK